MGGQRTWLSYRLHLHFKCFRHLCLQLSPSHAHRPWPSFAPDIEDDDHPIHEIKRKGGDLRYCKKCCLYKPPRSHHCRVCKRCVLRMDHHCVWMNNCVGHANYKVFFVFVVYALLACVYSLILLLGSLTVDTEQTEGSYRSVYILSGLLLIPLSMAIGVFLGWHIYLTLQNKTTIEYYEGVRAMLVAEQGGNVYTHPYDLGVGSEYPLLGLSRVKLHRIWSSLPNSIRPSWNCS